MGGGARSATWRQIIADVTGLPVEVMENGDASFGAALVAGIGVGVFASPADAVEKCVRVNSLCMADSARYQVYSGFFQIYKDAQAALAGLNHRLYGLVRR